MQGADFFELGRFGDRFSIFVFLFQFFAVIRAFG